MSYDKQKSKLKSMFALEESEEVFNAKMQKGLDDMRNGRITPCREGPFRCQEEIQENRSTGLDYASCD